ncbi:MAG: hypothetical protein RLZZ28_2033 [Bacteroidota bacterium]
MIWTTILKILFNLVTYGVFLYSILLLLSYILIGWYSVGETKKHMRKNAFTDFRVLAASVHAPTVSILAPAYNEGLNIVENVRSILSIFYANLEVIIINDGSKDDSLDKLIEAYDLYKVNYFIDEQIATKKVRGVYKSRKSIYHKLIVVDKENGGKADALNVGINISSNQYLVCIDVDCILEQDALLKMVKPFLEKTDKRVIATGGVVRIANSCTIEDGRLIKVALAEEYLPQIQILEYIRAFILGRMAWSRLNGLMLISGAFGAFDKEIAIKCGGYNSKTVGEDMELVVRMRRYMEEKGEPYIVTYIPDPLCWTEAPSTFKILGRQRNRWIRGTYETLQFHKIMFFNPRYGLLGMLSYPYWFFFELCAPLIEFFGFIFFLFMAGFGLLDWGFFFTYLLFILCFSYLYSCFAILMEVLTFHQYKRRIDILRLMLTGITEPFIYHPFVVYSAVKGLFDLFKKEKGWGEMTRQGLSKKTTSPAFPQDPSTITPAITATLAVAQAPSQYTNSGKRDSLLEKRIVPFFSLFVSFIAKAFAAFIKPALVLALLIVLLRIVELSINYAAHGMPLFFIKVVFSALLYDILFFLKYASVSFFVYALFYALSKRLAGIVFIVLAVLTLLIQLALSQYFVTTLVPLGADLWAYSIADINQTLGASGAVGFAKILLFGLVVLVSIPMLVYLPRRIRIRGVFTFVVFLLILISEGVDFTDFVKKHLPGQEYSNNLSLNKAAYFFEKSTAYFFPNNEETDIYASNQLTNSDNIKEVKAFAFPDEKNYPFLHTVDSTADVLSPFFNKDSLPPNMVILLVEGLGRAFTNEGAYLGNFTPFLDSLSQKSLYWENFLSEGGRTFAALPSVLGSLPFAKNGFNELGKSMPRHLSLINLLAHNGYGSSFFYGGDARFDNMQFYLENNHTGRIYDERSFSAAYTKMPGENGFTWGYGDKELFRSFFADKASNPKPMLNIFLTVSTHSPFLINEQDNYLNRFEKRMSDLRLPEYIKKQRRNYRQQFASILYTDDALQDFFEQYKKRPDFAHTVFILTGDHRIPEIPMSSKLDRYHVPLIIYSPLLKRTAKFSSISTHFDIAPTLLAWLKNSYGLSYPNMASWMGTGIDTARQFRNVHAYPIMQTKNDLVDFIKGAYLLNGTDLYRIDQNMDLSPESSETLQIQLKNSFNQFLQKNSRFAANPAILTPDSLLKKYAPQ